MKRLEKAKAWYDAQLSRLKHILKNRSAHIEVLNTRKMTRAPP